MAMSTIGIYHSELYRTSGGQKEEEEDNKTVNTTHSSVTIQRGNVSEFAKENNARAFVDGLLTRIGAEAVRIFLKRALSFVETVRDELHVDETVLSDEAIIQQAREFVRQRPPPPQDVIAHNDEAAALSSLCSSSSRPADGSAHAANAEIVDDLTNQSIGTIPIPHSTSSVGTAGAAVQAVEQDSNPDGMSDSVHDFLEPIGNEAAPAVSPPHPVQQQQDRRPGTKGTAAIANNYENGDNRQLSVALAAGAGDDVADISTDDNGHDEENKDRKPSAKKPRLG